MKRLSPGQITTILESINAGDAKAIDRLFPLVYEQLRTMAKARMVHEPRQTLQTTGLVHEVYLRLLQDEQPRWENRRHFFAVAAEAMRRILVENARRRSRLKRGGDWKKVELTENILSAEPDAESIMIFDQALSRLKRQDPLMSEVVQLRCFAGLTITEIALALSTSARNVDRRWAAAKHWLYQEMLRAGK